MSVHFPGVSTEAACNVIHYTNREATWTRNIRAAMTANLTATEFHVLVHPDHLVLGDHAAAGIDSSVDVGNTNAAAAAAATADGGVSLGSELTDVHGPVAVGGVDGTTTGGGEHGIVGPRLLDLLPGIMVMANGLVLRKVESPLLVRKGAVAGKTNAVDELMRRFSNPANAKEAAVAARLHSQEKQQAP